MKKTVLFASLWVAGMTAGVASAASMEMALLQEAMISGKTSLDLRLRGEWVDDTVHREAFAETLRTVLAYKTGDYHGLKAYVEFENISNFGRDDYRSTPSTTPLVPSEYAVVGDAELAQFNQAGLEGFGFRAGRQKIIYDNARFVGDVGWRQNDQTFDAISYSNSTLLPELTLSAAWAWRVLPPTGIRRNLEAPMVNIRYAGFPAAKFTLFYYGVEEKSAAGIIPGISPASSWQHAGAKVDGAIGDFLYEVSYAQQDDYADGTAASSPGADYTDLQLGYKFGPVTVKAQQEVLEKGFKTPLATLHAFNGWVDRFTTTPSNGLEDTNLKVMAKLDDWTLVLAGHHFAAETGGAEFGTEVDVSALYQYTKNLSFLAKYGKYEAKDVVAVTGAVANNKDVEKGWLQMQFKF